MSAFGGGMDHEGRDERVEALREHDHAKRRTARGCDRYGALTLVLCGSLLLHEGCTSPAYGDGDEHDAALCANALCSGPSNGDASPPGPSVGKDEGRSSDASVLLPPNQPPPNQPPPNQPLPNQPLQGSDISDARVNNPTGPADAATPSLPPTKVVPNTQSAFPLGNYVIQARYYGIESSSTTVGYAEEIILLGRVTRDPESNELKLRVEMCENYANTDAVGITTTARIASLPEYPARLYTLQVTGDVFQTTAPPTYAGYVPGNAETCPAGTLVTAPAVQTWHANGQCKCTSGDAPPTSIDDCRVIDSDGDSHPGFTVGWTGALNRTLYAVRRDSSQLVDGKISPDGRHTAAYLGKNDHVTLQCTSGSCSSSSAPAFRPCVSNVVNPTRFALLKELAPSGQAWTCKEMLQVTGSLFSEPLAVPKGC